ncbi:MAG: sugar transferase [Planctomycetota bacterium]|nr:sugar transferase [Planctomycetota bacterium]
MIMKNASVSEVVAVPRLKPRQKGGRANVKARPHSRHRLKHLHSRHDIESILHRESARCERNGHEFSVVIIAAAESGVTRHLHRLARLMCLRSRATDEIGWFDSHHICAVLPDTSPDGARDFLGQLTEEAYHRGLSPVGKVLTYPYQWTETQNPLDPESDDDITKPIGDITPLLIRPLPFWKRAIDLTLASIALIMLSPLMAVAALAIRLTDPGPVLFKQKRAGLGGKPFTIYKFRTMIADAEKKKAQLRARSEQDGPAFKIKHDPRITRVGRLLRETSLDELPQLINVIKGEMSLVGPRPLPLDESDNCDVWHRRRLDVTPGLTCIWQVQGRSQVSFAEWIRMDRAYIGRRSLWQDVKLIAMTVPSVLLRRGAR